MDDDDRAGEVVFAGSNTFICLFVCLRVMFRLVGSGAAGGGGEEAECRFAETRKRKTHPADCCDILDPSSARASLSEHSLLRLVKRALVSA